MHVEVAARGKIDQAWKWGESVESNKIVILLWDNRFFFIYFKCIILHLLDPLPALRCTVDVRDGSAQFVLLYTFLRIFTFSFYMHNVCTIYIR